MYTSFKVTTKEVSKNLLTTKNVSKNNNIYFSKSYYLKSQQKPTKDQKPCSALPFSFSIACNNIFFFKSYYQKSQQEPSIYTSF